MARKTLQIATLGLHANERVDYVLERKGADKIVLVCTERNMQDVEDFRERHRKTRFPIDHTLVTPWDYDAILTSVLEVILAHKAYDVAFNISCGTVAMRAACHMAAVLIGAPAYFVTEEDGNVIGDLEEVRPLSLSTMTKPKREILLALIEHDGSVSMQRELQGVDGLEAASVSKHIRALEREGYISVVRTGSKHAIKITQLGRAVLRLKEARGQRVWGRSSGDSKARK